ncbi:hypothetical protein ASPZODRAFT_144945 [Penicilliopsis zonata CBS 506.65]|uniref:Pal1 cell morphology protein n=1 Tax=Penicilliopsis zonata CBS 506.65 TaxID=1073090 RepID=A0A1L9SB27_9EURO|nr:hypothetical protein ASPZODRAFT_144945 [Penicilliopsis zonata CBS 506.65]OJJ44374.1 hypothetical protein ASPZODRAFT_144945 [Penicilliopsis zonata CBS 506.65]
MNASQQHPPVFSFPPAMGPPDRQGSPHSSINLASNNPFRNRALSPSMSSTRSGDRPERPLSTNPFIDDTDILSPQSAPGGTAAMSPSADTQVLTNNTRDLFENLSLDSSSQSKNYRPAPPPPEKLSQRPAPNSRPPPSRSDRDRDRDRDRSRSERTRDIFADPPRKPNGSSRRPMRRNSESSIMERTPKLLDVDDDRRRRERRHREREERSKDKDGKPRSKKPNQRLDIIDKLDVTSIYGTGMFHHDGPFDACNPHRNRKGVRTAPMQAFPKDSSNMALGGAGPVNSNIDLNLFHGTGTEGYNDYATSAYDPRKQETTVVDAHSRIDPVHGAASMGLGTSTFLEGTPASRSAMQRRESEGEAQMASGGGLQRKKSLAQRLRGMNNRSGSGRMVSPEASYIVPASSSHTGMIRANEKNPFFQDDYDDAWDKKGARIQLAEESRTGVDGPSRARSSSSPKQNTGLERRFTNERSTAGFDDKPTGFINRMKSLRKPRPERRVSNE